MPANVGLSVCDNTDYFDIQQVVVTEEDVRQQENKVEGARKKLEELLAAIEKTNRENMEKEGRPMSADSAKSVSEHHNSFIVLKEIALKGYYKQQMCKSPSGSGTDNANIRNGAKLKYIISLQRVDNCLK